MTRHTAYRFNLTQKAILATVAFGFGTLNSQAISLGQPAVQSTQHEPLSATIDVSNIDADQFEASIASNSIYAQMGLNQAANIQATFIRTSDTSGKIVLTSSEPISTPFADVVLNLSDKGEQIIEPQTLLVGLPKNNTADDTTSIHTPTPVANHVEETSTITTVANTSELTEPETLIITQNSEQELPVIDRESLVVKDITSEPFSLPEPAPVKIPVQTKPNTQSIYAPILADQTKEVLSSLTPEGLNTQFDILTEEITRTIYPKGTAPKSPKTNTIPTDNSSVDMMATQFDTNNKNTSAQTTKTPPNKPSSQQNSGASYVVQSGDNLWSIANQIAKANSMSIDVVMTALHEQNPDAFDDGQMSKLKANATLMIPAYDIIPSQQAIQEAISAKTTITPQKQTKASKNNNTAAVNANRNRGSSPQKTIVKPLPKPQVTLVTPSQSGEVTGGNTKVASKGHGQLINTLKSTRHQTAENARLVNGLSQELSSSIQKLELQNQKLAELEARLRILKQNQ